MKGSLVVLMGVMVLNIFARDDRAWMKFVAAGAPFKETAFDNVLFSCEQELKFDNSRLYEQKTLLMCGYRFSPYFSILAGHRFGTARDGEPHTFKTEQRPTLELQFATPEFATLKLDLRSRFEWRDKHGSQGYMRYRERFRLRTSWSISDFHISPYVSDEIFFSDKPKRDDADLFDRNRAQIGVSFRPVPALPELSGKLFFMVQHDMFANSSQWDPTNIYGFELGYRF